MSRKAMSVLLPCSIGNLIYKAAFVLLKIDMHQSGVEEGSQNQYVNPILCNYRRLPATNYSDLVTLFHRVQTFLDL